MAPLSGSHSAASEASTRSEWSDVLVSIEVAVEEVRRGRMVILVDDEDRENEGDLCIAAESVTPEIINFMAMHGRGLICLSLTESRIETLRIPMMVPDDQNTTGFGTAFTVSIGAAEGMRDGISAVDRAHTVQVALDAHSRPEDLRSPGHVFPLRARDGGVLRRAGQTEGSVDLARLAGLHPAGVICEIMNDDGTMARMPDLVDFARVHGLKICTIADLIEYRRRHEKHVRRGADAVLPTAHAGDWRCIVYENDLDRIEHVALVKGDVESAGEILVRVHSECLTGDAFASLRCDCGEQLEAAMRMIEREGRGVVLYMRQEGRGIGLGNKIRAYNLQDNEGLDTVEANERLGFPPDLRDYGIGAQMMVDLGLKRLRLITNNPGKRAGIEGYGLQIVERVALEIEPNEKNLEYLKTKKEKMGHALRLKI